HRRASGWTSGRLASRRFMIPSTNIHPSKRQPAEVAARLSRRRVLRAGALALGGSLVSVDFVSAQQTAPRILTIDLDGATLFQGAGCNVIAMSGPDGALMIDGGKAANADALLAAAMRATSASRIHTLINTHWHPDQTGANEAVGRGGGVILAHEKTRMYLS